MSPFLIPKGIQGIFGIPKSVKKLKSGALLVELTKEKTNNQSTSLLNLKAMANIFAVSKFNRGLN